MELKALVYTSWARPGIRAAEIDAILAVSRINNPLDGISGVLIFNGTGFMQILEGSQAAVDNLLPRLAGDPRHSNMAVRDQRLITTRIFPDWTMAFVRLEGGRFEGDHVVARALERDLPVAWRNILAGMTHALGLPPG